MVKLTSSINVEQHSFLLIRTLINVHVRRSCLMFAHFLLTYFSLETGLMITWTWQLTDRVTAPELASWLPSQISTAEKTTVPRPPRWWRCHSSPILLSLILWMWKASHPLHCRTAHSPSWNGAESGREKWEEEGKIDLQKNRLWKKMIVQGNVARFVILFVKLGVGGTPNLVTLPVQNLLTTLTSS